MARAMMVCSGGGHLKQLFELSRRMDIAPEDQVWVTFENGQSISLLADRRTVFVPFAAPRDYRSIFRLSMIARKMLRQDSDYDLAISTGSSPAVAFLPLAARRGISSHYIESAARAEGPSVSGKIIERFRQVHTYTQYPEWSGERWKYRGSIYDAYSPGPDFLEKRSLRRAVVSVGTQEGYSFDRLLRVLVPLLADFDEVLWQTGTEDVSRYGITAHHSIPHDEMNAAVAAADVVIMHCGTGSALTAMNSGKCAILVPRRKEFGEHVDDHQVQIGRELASRGLAITLSPEEITLDALRLAAGRSVLRTTPPPFVLDSQQSAQAD